MNVMPPPNPVDRAPVRAPQPAVTEQRISSRQLLGDAKEVLIEHHGAVYRLRETSLGKLILTK
ncbi:hemin uptake protein HemP [Piscinibacter sp. HJYY11]|uniref:hemin uptake protein HemP n=1 Tax=Piscinibacter sp. HJYY11 TaxID=2801333 RepID=UPI00191FFF70|nr:hemin uptake protein HemP [Piscinibacter sp. HJYY11]MBL0728930.1 hemin uptake protein HemP [Piscinibacter sp. HJYY11]